MNSREFKKLVGQRANMAIPRHWLDYWVSSGKVFAKTTVEGRRIFSAKEVDRAVELAKSAAQITQQRKGSNNAE